MRAARSMNKGQCSMKETLNRGDRNSVKSYNAEIDLYALTIERHNDELLPELADRRADFNANAREYNRDCARKGVR
jgi:hypothetical protein